MMFLDIKLYKKLLDVHKIKYKCKYCGQVIPACQRIVHAHKHHPTVPWSSLHIFLDIDFKSVLRRVKTVAPSSPKTERKRVDSDIPKISPSKDIGYDRKTGGKNDVNQVFKGVSLNETDRNGKSENKISETNEEKESESLKYKPADVPNGYKSSQAKDLFEYAVKRIAHKYQTDSDILTPKTHQEWMNHCFDRRYVSTPLREEFMSRIKATYSEYFKKGSGRKYTFDFEKIARDYPHFFAFCKGGKKELKGLDGMIEAMKIEINLSKQPDKRDKYKVDGIITIDEEKKLYGLKIELDDSKNISFNESLNVSLRIDESWYNCDCIDFNEDESILYVSSNRKIFGYKGMLYVDTTFILEKILEKLLHVKFNGLGQNQPAEKFLNDSTASLSNVSPTIFGAYKEIISNMDSSQKKAVDETIKHDISFIWGPPGTGKSYTLAGLINILAQRKENTLVCCISNVAVDQLLNKVIDNNSSLKN